MGLLLAASRFGIVDLGDLAVDLQTLSLNFDAALPALAIRPRYSDDTASVFERAATAAVR